MGKPFVSIVIPTFNAQKYLGLCLRSIKKQTYPKSRYEVLVIDGGSTDKTVKIARLLGAKLLQNPKRDAESGKAIGIRASKGEVIALIDADNELIQKAWLSEMVRPLLEDRTIFGVESPWRVKKYDSLLNQYFAMLRIADPLARKFHPHAKAIRKEGYMIYEVLMGQTPVIGANGFLYRKRFITRLGVGEKFEEVNFVAQMVKKGFVRYAIPERVGIYHHYVTSLWDYVKKRIKIGRKFMARKGKGQATWVDQTTKTDFVKAVLYNASVIGPFFEAVREFRKTKNPAWFWHPIVALVTIITYCIVFLYYSLQKHEH